MPYGMRKHRNKGNEELIEIDWPSSRNGEFKGLELGELVQLKCLQE